MTNGSESSVVTREQWDLLQRLENIFMPYATKQRQTFFQSGPDQTQARFVHYTSAESALSIIKSKRFWMRNTNCMADYREVQHGFDIFNSLFLNEVKRKAFIEALDACTPGAAEEAIGLFNQSWGDIRFNTYIASVSEHDAKEDLHGRLSMWRAFGRNVARVGIVLRVPWFSLAPVALNIVFSPVAYLSEASAHEVIEEVIANVKTNSVFLRSVNHSVVVRTVFIMLLAGVVCLKHEGFREEREWRAIYAPKRGPSALMESSTEVIGGIPQIVHKIPLDGTVSELLADLDLSRLFDRLIVGPTPYPWDGWHTLLTQRGLRGAASLSKRKADGRVPHLSRSDRWVLARIRSWHVRTPACVLRPRGGEIA